jgi:Tfp pilus assembly protein PilW
VQLRSLVVLNRDESGFTVVELAITLMISMIVMASILGMLHSQTQAERRVADVADSQEAIRLAYVELTSDLRSADPVLEADGTSVRLQLRDAAGAVRTVRWSVDATAAGGLELVRHEVAANGTESVSYRLAGVASGPVFTWFKAGTTPVTVAAADVRTCAKRAQVVLRATAVGRGAPLVLESDVDLRNAAVTSLC